MPPASVLAYAQLVAAELIPASGGLLRAVYLHGSAALGGWQAGRSDVDMLLITDDATGTGTQGKITSALVATAGVCPGRGLEASVVGSAQARAPAPPWPFLLHVVTGPAEPGGCSVVPGAQQDGDRDLLMHYAVCRSAGWAVHGPPPAELIGEIPRQLILGYLSDEMEWGLEHSSEAYAVLNACRAAVYRSEDQIVSKIAGGEAALRHCAGPTAVIGRALAQQRGQAPGQPPQPDAAEFVRATAAALRSAAREG
jgi:hypothetical protein